MAMLLSQNHYKLAGLKRKAARPSPFHRGGPGSGLIHIMMKTDL